MASPQTLYIPSYTSLGNHPKLIKFARRLGVSNVQAVGHLHYFWWWAMTYAPDGNLSNFNAEDVAIGAQWDGPIEAIFTALIEAGFINNDEHTIHDWPEYGGKLASVRLRNAEKQRRHRNVTVISPSPLRRGEESREEEKNSIATSGRKQHVYSEEFNKFWQMYPSTNEAKLASFKAWKTLSRADQLLAIEGLPKWIASEHWQNGFVKYSAYWLKNRMYEQNPTAKKSNGHALPPGAPSWYYDDDGQGFDLSLPQNAKYIPLALEQSGHD